MSAHQDDYWAILELAPTPEQREVKRAYARLAKQIRAEDDPEGFQRLRRAYEQALQHAAWLQHQQDMPVETAGPEELAAGSSGPEISQEPDEHASAAPVSQTVDRWLAELAGLLDAGRPEQAVEKLGTILASPHASLPLLRQQFSSVLLQYLTECRSVSLTFAKAANTALLWDELSTVTAAQRQWLQRFSDYRIRDEGLRQGPFLLGLAPENMAAFLDSEFSRRQDHGLEDRDWFELGLIVALTHEPVSLAQIDAIAEYFGWNKDISSLQRLQPADVQPFLNKVHALRQTDNETRYEDNLRRFANGPKPARPQERAAQKAAKALLEPYDHVEAWLCALSVDTQRQARAIVSEMDNQFPAVAGRLDARTLAFWRKEHPHYGDAVVGNSIMLLVIGFLVSLAVVQFVDSSVVLVTVVVTMLSLPLAGPLLGWWAMRRLIKPGLHKLQQYDLAFTQCWAPHKLRPLVNAGSFLLGWRLAATAICSVMGSVVAWSLTPAGRGFTQADGSTWMVAWFGALLPWIALWITLGRKRDQAARELEAALKGKSGQFPWWLVGLIALMASRMLAMMGGSH